MTTPSQPSEPHTLSFSNELIRAQTVTSVRDYAVEGAVVVNLSSSPIETGGVVPGIVPPWRSTFLADAKILAAERVAIVSVPTPANLGGLPLFGWRWYGDLNKKFGRNLPLYVSPQESVGRVEVDPWFLTNQVQIERERLEFEVKLNLWWAPPETDCSIHIEHPFLELHSQIYGVGRMQKFRERDAATLYEDVRMAPGMTHEPFARMTAKQSWEYPWHRYYADTSCVWLAIEFHLTRQ